MLPGTVRHRSRLHLAMRGQHLLHGAKGLASEFARHRVGAADVSVDHSQQTYRLPLLFKFLVNSGMIASENAHAHHGDGDRILRWQEKFPVASCRKGIVNGNQGKSTISGSSRFRAARQVSQPLSSRKRARESLEKENALQSQIQKGLIRTMRTI